MNGLEIIRLRSAEIPFELLKETLATIPDVGQSGLVRIKIYRHAVLDSDLSVHLHWKSEGPPQDKSTLGLRLAQALQEFGLIDHSLWIEGKDYKNNPERRRKK